MATIKMSRETKLMYHTSTRPALILLAINVVLQVFFCHNSLSSITLSNFILVSTVAFRHQKPYCKKYIGYRNLVCLAICLTVKKGMKKNLHNLKLDP